MSKNEEFFSHTHRDVHMIIEEQIFFPGPLHNMESNVKLKNKVLIES